MAFVLAATLSWRKWPDPIVDFGQQCYAVWRLTQGAALYHDFVWNYGPFSICFNAWLFRCFGPGIMVLAAANLVIYGLIGAGVFRVSDGVGTTGGVRGVGGIHFGIFVFAFPGDWQL